LALAKKSSKRLKKAQKSSKRLKTAQKSSKSLSLPASPPFFEPQKNEKKKLKINLKIRYTSRFRFLNNLKQSFF
jgi:hypothetical protein